MHDPFAAINRRELLKYGSTGTAIVAAGGVLAACGGSNGVNKAADDTNGSPGPSKDGTPVKGGTLTIGVLSNGSSETVDVRKAIVTPDAIRVQALYDPLFRAVPGGTAPALAESAEANADATKWTIKLRDGVTWHDGKPLTADDVVYTIRSSWGSDESNYGAPTKALIDLKNVRKVDRLTVEVPLLRPFSGFEAFTSFYTAHVVQDGTKDFKKPIGTGPFKFDTFQAGVRSSFTANPDYWDGAPNIDTLVVDSSFTDDAARLNALTAGQVDIAPNTPAALAKANASSGGVVLGNAPGPGFIAIAMRVNVPPFNDERVVQAFKLAVDRQKVIDNAFSGYATLGNDAPGATFEHWVSDVKPVYDPEKAKALLKAAGQADLSVPLMTAPALPGMDETATIVSSQLKAIGVNAPLKRTPVSTYYTSATPAYASDKRLLFSTYWNSIAPSLAGFYLSALTPDCQYNETGWGNRKGSQDLVQRALAETDPAKAKEAWRDAQMEQIQKGGYIVPANFNYLDAYSAKVRGVQTTQAGSNDNFNYAKAWITAA